MTWWVHAVYHSLGAAALVSWIFWVLLSITLHELGHGYAAIRQGDRTPIELDRMTLNPIVHMGRMSLLMFAVAGIAWGAMPVSPHRFRDGRLGDVIVAAAGPFVNLLLVILNVILVTAWMALVPIDSAVYSVGAIFFYQGIMLNVVLGIFNLLPVPPLDGSRILAGIWHRADTLFRHPDAAVIGLFIFLAIFFMSPLGDILWVVADGVSDGLVNLLGNVTGNPDIRDVIHPFVLRGEWTIDEATMYRQMIGSQ